MATRSEHKTIGQAIAELVKEYGQDTIGIMILNDALREALQVKGSFMYYDDNHSKQLYHNSPRYKELDAIERASIARVREYLENR